MFNLISMTVQLIERSVQCFLITSNKENISNCIAQGPCMIMAFIPSQCKFTKNNHCHTEPYAHIAYFVMHEPIRSMTGTHLIVSI